MRHADTSPTPPTPRRLEASANLGFARRTLIATGVVACVLLSLVFLWYAADFLLLIFGGVLLSVLLQGFTRLVRRGTPLGQSWALLLVTLLFLALIGAVLWLISGRIGTQVEELRQQLPKAIESVSERLEHYEWLRPMVHNLPSAGEWLGGNRGVLTRITGVASTTLGALLNVVLILIIGLYLAAQPELYTGGIKHLLPVRYRDRADDVLGVLDEALWRWLIGRVILMLLNGALTATGLWLLGSPLALTLGVLAGFLNFIPNFGPWIAAIPAVLLAFVQGPQQALYVALWYLVVQMLDGYVLTPMVDRRSVELPPVLTIAAQVLLGLFFGFLGILLASPLTAVFMLLVKMLYVEDVLGDPVMQESAITAPEGESPGHQAGAES